MLRYMLDTDISSYVMKGSEPGVMKHLASVSVGDVCISAISKAELLYGVEVSPRSEQDHARLDIFLRHVVVLDFPQDAALDYAEIRAWLKKRGTMIGANDLFIAAQDFTIPVTAPPVNFTSQIGATVITGSSLNSLSFTSCLDQANELGPPSGTFCGVPAGSIMLSPSITTAGPFFNTQTTISVAALAAPYAVDQRLTLILGAGASVDLSTTLISAVTPVPEPASGTLLGGIAILLVVGRLIPRSIPRSLRS